MKIILCLIGAIYCFICSIDITSSAVSVMHQIYAQIYSLMSAMFFCSACIIESISQSKQEKNHNKKSDDENLYSSGSNPNKNYEKTIEKENSEDLLGKIRKYFKDNEIE